MQGQGHLLKPTHCLAIRLHVVLCADAVDRAARAVGCFATAQEAGIARDLGIGWRQLALGSSLEVASEPYNARLPM